MNLDEKINASRRVEIKVMHMTFHGRRPTYEEYGLLFRDRVTDAEFVRRYIDGWAAVRACDLLPGESEEVVKFDKQLLSAAIPDLPHIFGPIAAQLSDAVMKHNKLTEENAKNLHAG